MSYPAVAIQRNSLIFSIGEGTTSRKSEFHGAFKNWQPEILHNSDFQHTPTGEQTNVLRHT
jgi:hypothetical protein